MFISEGGKQDLNTEREDKEQSLNSLFVLHC